MTRLQTPRARRARPRPAHPIRPAESATPVGLSWLAGAELAAGGLGLLATVHLARSLGPGAFGRLEFAAALAGWLLVVVRGGIEQIVQREAARRPRLIGPLTDLLIGMKLAAASAGLILVVGAAWLAGAGQGGAIVAAGLILLPTALTADVGPRARGRLRPIALAQAIRSSAYALGAWTLVNRPTDLPLAAGCAAIGECASALILLEVHRRADGWPRPRFGRRAWAVLARRGATASLLRFTRVGLYGADMLVLGWLASTAVGPYAAARRLVLALVALGLIVPAGIAPAIARAWTFGEASARRVVALWSARLLGLSIVATLGLMLTAGRWMPALFGTSYRDGGPWLALAAARLPFLLAASFAQSALVACRRESWALRQVGGMAALTMFALPIGALGWGAWGVGLAVLLVEGVGALLGGIGLGRLGLAVVDRAELLPLIVGGVVAAGVCIIGSRWPIGALTAASAMSFGAAWGVSRRATA